MDTVLIKDSDTLQILDLSPYDFIDLSKLDDKDLKKLFIATFEEAAKRNKRWHLL